MKSKQRNSLTSVVTSTVLKENNEDLIETFTPTNAQTSVEKQHVFKYPAENDYGQIGNLTN